MTNIEAVEQLMRIRRRWVTEKESEALKMAMELLSTHDKLMEDEYLKGFYSGQNNILEAQAEASWGGETDESLGSL